MPSELLQTILRYLLPALANTTVQELALRFRKRREKHAVDHRGPRSKGRKRRRVDGYNRAERNTLGTFPNGNLDHSLVDSDRMRGKSEHRLLSEGASICMWTGLLVEMVLSFMVLGVSSSPDFLVNANLQLMGVLGSGVNIVITFLVVFVVLRNYEREYRRLWDQAGRARR